MARKQEPLTFAGSLESQAQKPLDARRKVTLIADLTDAASFPYIFSGLDVYCEENQKWYTFLGGNQTDANNWRMEGSGGGGGSTDWNDITNKPTDLVQDVAYVHTDNNFTDTDKAKVDDTYTKAQTDQKIAEGIATVDSEHFHPVTVLPDVADAKENHEYILIEYEQDGVTIKSKKFYLFYDGAYHEDRAAGVSLDGYATEQYVDDGLATKQDELTAGNGIDATKLANGEIATKGTPIKWYEAGAGNTPGFSLVDETNSSTDWQSRVRVVGNADYVEMEFYNRLKNPNRVTKNLPTVDAVNTLVDAKQDTITGGAEGDVLVKASDTDGDFSWRHLGKDNMIYDVLWEGSATSGSLSLSRPITDYDELVFSMAYGGEHQMPKTFMSNDIVFGTTICGDNMTGSAYLWGVFDDATTYRITGAAGGATIYKITGIVFSRLDGTIGRWEKIGEWTGNQTGLQLDLSPYSAISFSPIYSNQSPRNSVVVPLSDFDEGEALISENGDTWQGEFQNKGNNTYDIRLTGASKSVLYGYKEAAISDADVQRIAEQVPSGGLPKGGTTGQVLAKKSDADGDTEWVTGGAGGGNANFDIGTVPLGGAGVYEVNAILNNNDSESVHSVYSRGANGELPDWFSLQVTSGLGTDNFEVSTRGYTEQKAAQAQSNAQTYADLKLTQKQDKLVSGQNIKTINGESLLGAGNVVAGINFEVGVEKWYGTYTENGVTYQVYSKLLELGPLPSAAGVTNYPHGITGIKQILQINGFTNDGFVMNAPRQTAADNISIYQAQKSGNIAIEVGKDRSNKNGFVMLIYAKNN